MSSKQELSPKMLECIEHMKKHDNKLVRFPGGYWAREGWHSWNGPCFGTPTVEAIVKRGMAFYSVWKTGKRNKFPIECRLTSACTLTGGDSATPEKSSPPDGDPTPRFDLIPPTGK
jgi:hypothetical protein